MQRLYAEEGVNPTASCLPMLLQAPVFLSLYRVLQGVADHQVRGYWFHVNPDLVTSLQEASLSGARLSGRIFPMDSFGPTQLLGVVLTPLLVTPLFLTQLQLMRKNMPPEALTRLIEEAGGQEQGGILAVPVADTLKRADGKNHIGETVSRAGLWQAQTPQLFQTALLHRALSVEDLSDITDEASAVEKLGVQPLLVQGDTRNLKLTLPQDEFIVRLLLQVV